MSYETLLTVTPTISTSNGVNSFVVNAGLDASILLDVGNTTLGSFLTDDVCRLVLNTDPDSTGTGLSASAGTTSINLTLSSPTALSVPQVWPGVITSSTFKNGVSATATITWPISLGRATSLANTVINLSANATTVVLDTTKPSTLDNFFYLTGSPDSNHQVRTTYGHSRLVSYLG